MATLDGYSPYPVSLTAEQTVWAIQRSYNLDDELINYVLRTIDDDVPDSAVMGDYFTDEEREFRAFVEGTNYLWIEI